MSDKRLESWAQRLLSVKDRKLVLLLVSILAGIVLVGTAWEKSQPFLQLFARASSDATEIGRIRKDVEQQRDAIGLISRDANNARVEIEKVAELSQKAQQRADEATDQTTQIRKLQGEAKDVLEQIRETSDFSFLLARAAADDRKAFDELLRHAEQAGNAFHDLAVSAIVRIAGDLGSSLRFGIDWKLIGIDPATTDFEEFKEIFRARPAFDKPGILLELWHQERFSKFDRLSFLRDVIKSTDSILVLHAACQAMNEEAKINRNVIGYAQYLDWWFEHAKEYTGVKNYKPPEDIQLPVDSILSVPSPSPSIPR